VDPDVDPVSGLRTCLTDRYQDVRDTPPSVGGVDRDRAAVSRSPGSRSPDSAGQTVTVEDADTTFRVYDGDQLLAAVPRTTTRPIARFKARKPEPPRRRSPRRPQERSDPHDSDVIASQT
jgi:hypothetical protein